MNKKYIILAASLIISNISACLNKFIQENPAISITADCKPKHIARQNFIKYCLEQNNCNFKNTKVNDYISEKTIKSLTNLSDNKSYLEIDNTIFTAIKNYKNDKTNKKSKYRELMDSINPLNNNSAIEKHLFQVFKPETDPVKAFFKDHAPEIAISSVIISAISLLGLRFFNKKPNMGPNLCGDNNLPSNPSPKNPNTRFTTKKTYKSSTEVPTNTKNVASCSNGWESLAPVSTDPTPLVPKNQVQEFKIEVANVKINNKAKEVLLNKVSIVEVSEEEVNTQEPTEAPAISINSELDRLLESQARFDEIHNIKLARINLGISALLKEIDSATKVPTIIVSDELASEESLAPQTVLEEETQTANDHLMKTLPPRPVKESVESPILYGSNSTDLEYSATPPQRKTIHNNQSSEEVEKSKKSDIKDQSPEIKTEQAEQGQSEDYAVPSAPAIPNFKKPNVAGRRNKTKSTPIAESSDPKTTMLEAIKGGVKLKPVDKSKIPVKIEKKDADKFNTGPLDKAREMNPDLGNSISTDLTQSGMEAWGLGSKASKKPVEENNKKTDNQSSSEEPVAESSSTAENKNTEPSNTTEIPAVNKEDSEKQNGNDGKKSTEFADKEKPGTNKKLTSSAVKAVEQQSYNNLGTSADKSW